MISPLTALPTLTGQVTIDATTEAGYSGTPLVVVNGSRAGGGVEGLTVSGGHDTVRGLAIDGFSGDGLLFLGATNGTAAGDYVGVDASGAGAGNGGSGIIVRYGSGVTVGGTGRFDGNLVSANGWRGVWLDSSQGDAILGDRIGTNAAGSAGLGNGGDGVSVVWSSHNSVDNNLISGNARVGIWLNGQDATGNQVGGNIIGLDAPGKAALPNGITGVMLADAPNNVVGGTTAAARNVISGNIYDGVLITGGGSSGEVVQGNEIGTNASGNAAIPNTGSGVEIDNGGSDAIGGSAPGAGNVISGNDVSGVQVVASSGDTVAGNLIGTDASGQGRVANKKQGVELRSGSSRDTIGGPSAGSANVISGNGCDGVDLWGLGTSDDVVEGDKIGTDLAGDKALINGGNGVEVNFGADNITVGGPAAGAGNLISGNSRNGVELSESTGDAVIGNLIGTDASGKAPIGNTLSGVFVNAANNAISGNVISGNVAEGIWVKGGESTTTVLANVNYYGGDTTNVVISDNKIGTTADGTAALANGTDGIDLDGANNLQIKSNVISGNKGFGINFEGVTNHVSAVDNLIGTIAGDADLANGLGNLAFVPTTTHVTVTGNVLTKGHPGIVGAPGLGSVVQAS